MVRHGLDQKDDGIVFFAALRLVYGLPKIRSGYVSRLLHKSHLDLFTTDHVSAENRGKPDTYSDCYRYIST